MSTFLSSSAWKFRSISLRQAKEVHKLKNSNEKKSVLVVAVYNISFLVKCAFKSMSWYFYLPKSKLLHNFMLIFGKVLFATKESQCDASENEGPFDNQIQIRS